MKRKRKFPKEYLTVLSEEELHLLFLEAQRNQAERKGHRECVRRCDFEIKKLYDMSLTLR